MLVTTSRHISCSNTLTSYLASSNGNGNKPHVNVTYACKKDFSEISSKQKKALYPLKLPISRKLAVQSAAAVFALGFIDAGYSGDWSRIGVISRGTEDLLKVAAFVVVPLCLFVIVVSNRTET